MADENIRDEDIAAAESESAAATSQTQGSANAFPDETMSRADLSEDEAAILKRRAAASAVDGNAASHQGGMGAQSGQTDFGAAGNLQGYDKSAI